MDKRIEALREKIVTHDMSRTLLYAKWCSMNARCYNKGNKSYTYYGGRGITVCNEWRFDFASFRDYVSTLDGFGVDELSLDRIRNNEGYKPGNLRWATKREQCLNQRKRTDSVSGYTGVYKNRTTWKSAITIHGKNIPIGYFKTIKEAVFARNKYIIKNKLINYKIQIYMYD